MKILVALDISSQTDFVVERALDLIKFFKAEGTFYTVAEEILDFGDGIASGLGEKVREKSQKNLYTALEKAQAKGIHATEVLESGTSPADSILNYAEKKSVDLIIMGSRAKTELDRFLIGSVASKVVSHATCSVLVLR
ncbi:MAG: UspA domain-containing [Desulfovibrionaceae bacterium]|nr:MAG: UspA domain-containing [Desulfovibrionaceae bacterium]